MKNSKVRNLFKIDIFKYQNEASIINSENGLIFQKNVLDAYIYSNLTWSKILKLSKKNCTLEPRDSPVI